MAGLPWGSNRGPSVDRSAFVVMLSNVAERVEKVDELVAENNGRRDTPALQAMRDEHLRRRLSPEQRERISQAQRLRWQRRRAKSS